MSTEVQWFIILSLMLHGAIYLFASSTSQLIAHKEISVRRHFFAFPASYAVTVSLLMWGPGGIIKSLGLLLCLAISTFCFFTAIQAFRADPKKWEENRQAVHLARKVNQGIELTSEEETLFSELKMQGVLRTKPIGMVYCLRSNTLKGYRWELAEGRIKEWLLKPFW